MTLTFSIFIQNVVIFCCGNQNGTRYSLLATVVYITFSNQIASHLEMVVHLNKIWEDKQTWIYIYIDMALVKMKFLTVSLALSLLLIFLYIFSLFSLSLCHSHILNKFFVMEPKSVYASANITATKNSNH